MANTNLIKVLIENKEYEIESEIKDLMNYFSEVESL